VNSYNAETLVRQLKELFDSQYLGVLATSEHGQPYTSLVAFAATEDLKSIYFATGRSTRKFANLQSDPRVSMLIDNRSNRASDIAHAMAATVTGLAAELSGNDQAAARAHYLAKLPHMEEFVEAPSIALVQLSVARYYVVDRFQHVRELEIRS